ncbi:methyltransferase, TIGR04325 family [Plastoroseomonas hellenica]|uniref:methyltransferase, TIGR04325 family n=1 Tax=Plastoroseomonas hellenica TaxID=2687306 RepID=UPI001BA4D2CC|nr:methyltransferase, TIGR04325 family [Plastoroseomonas hellenica]MBR0646531.1 methyltransferase, TIGR04325 family [Plastoroseomonas hellenica]
MTPAQKIRSGQDRLSVQAGALMRPGAQRITPDSLRQNQATCPVIQGVFGHQRQFAGIEEARAYIQAYARSEGEIPSDLLWHLSASERAYLSDYPALFHLDTNREAIRTVFDLGGNAGAMFYRYDEHLHWPADFAWTICDSPKNLEYAARHAKKRREERLLFTTMPETMDGSDLLLISGALQYYQDPVGMVAAAPNRPRFILVNRSPLTSMGTYAVVQDVGHWLAACVVHNRARLYQGLQALGYVLRDEWPAPEFEIQVPGSPAFSVAQYSGFFMERPDPAPEALPAPA